MLVVTVTGEIPAGVNYLELMLESSEADWAHEELRSRGLHNFIVGC